jgi:CheY-like chemotaxis protein
MGNAIKFTETGGVALTLQPTPGAGSDAGEGAMLRFAVRDTGPGVPPDAIERIFAEFEQADQGPARRHGGTGLGLAISKRLTSEMGGRIGVTSLPGAGATFTVDLPFAAPARNDTVGSAWPRPQAGERVLVVLEGTIEPGLAGGLLVEAGASVVRVRMKDAARIAAQASEGGAPFTALLTDRAAIAQGAAGLLPLLAAAPAGAAPRAVVVIDPAERGDIPSLREQGFAFYLVRPVRPHSLLTQLFGHAEDDRTKSRDGADRSQGRQTVRKPSERLAVLLAEDNDINALLACAALEKLGARVARARSGAEAVAKASAARDLAEDFDLVLMDIHMPDLDGVEAARAIRALYPENAEPGRGRPPVVALTANAIAEDRATYLAAGLDDYLAKPFEKADLAALLARWRGAQGKTGRGAA